GAPELGVAGAAIATVFGQFLAMCLGLILLLTGKHEVHVHISKFKLSGATIKNIYAVGFPSIVMQSIMSVMVIGLNGILITFSSAAVAVLGAYFKLQSFVFMPVFGLNQGAMPIFGYNYGAKNKERLMTAYKLALLIALMIMIVGTVIFQVFPKQLLSLFSASEAMIEIGVPALRIISTCFIFAAFGIISATLFQATGHGMLSLLISLLRQLILILPITYILAQLFGLGYLWFSFPLAEIFSVFATVLCLRYL
ncbi:MAG: MATE family efflux transporter, partial [Anaerovorax sp.]